MTIGWPCCTDPVEPEPEAPADVVGEMVTSNTTGRNIGYRVTSTSLAGSWMGNSMSRFILPPQTPGDKESGRLVKEMGHGQMWFFLEPDGYFNAYADGNRDGGQIIRGGRWDGRLFKVSDYCFNLVNEDEEEVTFGEIYYPVFLNPARDHATIFTLDTSIAFAGEAPHCRDYGSLFGEFQWFTKIKDTVDLDIMRDIRAISDQWLWQPQPEDGAPGEQYPDTCP